MKKILCTAALASNFLLGMSDVSGMEMKFPELLAAINTQNSMSSAVEMIEINDELFETSTPLKIASSITSGDAEALNEVQLNEQISFSKLIELFENGTKIVLINDVIAFVPTIDGIKFVCKNPEQEEKARSIAKAISPRIRPATSNDIEFLRNRKASNIIKEYRANELAEDAKRNALKTQFNIEGDDISLFDIILKDDVDAFTTVVKNFADAQYKDSFILSTVSGSTHIFKYCYLTPDFLNKVDLNTLTPLVLASGNMEMVHILENMKLYEDKTIADLINKNTTPFVSNDIFDWLCLHWEIAYVDRQYTDFIGLLLEEGQFAYAVEAMKANEINATNLHANYNELLPSAAKGGCLQFVKYLIEKCNCNVNARGYKGKTPLHFASKKGHLDIVKYLVEECHVNVEDESSSSQWTPLHFASHRGHLDIVKYLVEECHADVEAKSTTNHWNPLLLASENGHLDIVKYLVEECHCKFWVKDLNTYTPLHYASKNGHLDIVKYFVKEWHAKVDVKTYYGGTPLLLASENGHLDIVKYLIEECDCDVEAKDRMGRTLLHAASANGHLDIVKYAVEKCHCNINDQCAYENPWNYTYDFMIHPENRNKTPLYLALHKKHFDIADFFIKKCNFDINKSQDILSILHLASSAGNQTDMHRDVIQYLVDNGIDVNAKFAAGCGYSKYGYGHTPLYYAYKDRQFEALKYLIEKCHCDIEAKDDYDWTIVHHVAYDGCLNIVKYLVEECHCNVEAKNNKGLTPLLLASEKGHLDIVKYLIEECHCNVEAKNNNDMTPLLLASEKGHLDIVKYLVETANVQITEKIIDVAKDKEIKTYLNFQFNSESEFFDLIRNGDFKKVKKFVDNQLVRIEAKDDNGNTPLYIAAQEAQSDIVQYLVEECHAEITDRIIDNAKSDEIKDYLRGKHKK